MIFILLALSFADLSKHIDAAKAQYASKLTSHNLDVESCVDGRSTIRSHAFTDTTTFIKDDERITCINSKYAFAVNKKNGKQYVETISTQPSEKMLANRKLIKIIEVLPWECHLLGVNLCTLTNFYDVETKSVEEDGNDLKVSVLLKAKPQTKKQVKSAVFWIDKASYRLNKYDVTATTNGPDINHKGVKIYQGDMLATETVDTTANGTTQRVVYRFSYPVKSEAEMEVATKLSTYGFPEPEVTQADNTFYWYLFGGAAVLLVIGLLLKK